MSHGHQGGAESAQTWRPRCHQRPWGAAAVLAVGGLMLMLEAVRPQPMAAPATPCQRVALLDEQLVCDAKVPETIGAWCGDGVHDSIPIHSGDALKRENICTLGAEAVHAQAQGSTRMSPQALAEFGVPVDINRADLDELISLPRVGRVMARRIVEGRPYRKVEQLQTIRGIGPATLKRLRPRVYVDDP